MSKLILLNGFKKTGKDELIKYLLAKKYNIEQKECKDHLHKLTQLFFYIKSKTYWDIYNNRATKELPLRIFEIKVNNDFESDQLLNVLGINIKPNYSVYLSIRQAMIYVSEIICKPRFGKEYFGKAKVSDLKTGKVYIDGSCGFIEELEPQIDAVGMDNILLLRIHRKGCEKGNDSRIMIPDGVIDNTLDIYNNDTINEYFNECEGHIKKFIDKRVNFRYDFTDFVPNGLFE